MELIIFNILLLVVTGTQSKQSDVGPQTFKNLDLSLSGSLFEPARNQEKYESKYDIIYLRPRQIDDLKSGKAFISSQQSVEFEHGKVKQEQVYIFNKKSQDGTTESEAELLRPVKPEELPKEDSLIPLEFLPATQPIEKVTKESFFTSLPKKEFVDNLKGYNRFSKNTDQEKLRYTEPKINETPKQTVTDQDDKTGIFLDSLSPLILDKAYSLGQSLGHIDSRNLENKQEYLSNFKEYYENIQKDSLLRTRTIKPVEEQEEVPLTPLEFSQRTKANESPFIPLSQNIYENNFDISNYFDNKSEQKKNTYPKSEENKAFENLFRNQDNKNGKEVESTIPLTLISNTKSKGSSFKPRQLQWNPDLENSQLKTKTIPLLSIDLNDLISLRNSQLNQAPKYENAKTFDENKHLNYHQELEKNKLLTEIVSIANSLPIITNSKINGRTLE